MDGGAGGGFVVPGTPGSNVLPAVEDQAPSLPTSELPFGDGNGDDTLDSAQFNVASVPTFGDAAGASEVEYVTIAAAPDTVLTNVYTIDPAATDDEIPPIPETWEEADVLLPEGLVKFKVLNVEPGATETISIFTDSTVGVTGYAKYDASGGWQMLPTGRVTIVDLNRVDIELSDGGIGDADGEENGIIDDPGGLAIADDTESPIVQITGPEDSRTYRPGEAPVAECEASDNIALNGECELTATPSDPDALGPITITARAVDWRGNVGTTSLTYRVAVDSTPPVVTGTVTATPNEHGWYNGDVTVTWEVLDPEPSSGVVSNPGATTLTGQGADLTATSSEVCDNAGNCAVGTVDGINIDRTSPAVAVDIAGDEESASPPLLPTYLLGKEPTLSCSATDALSGLDGECTAEVTGGNENGVGSFTYTATAWDKAGNEAAATFQYRVIYRVDGFAQPINDPSLVPNATRSIFKAGSTVPVKFQVKRADGAVVHPISAPQWLAPVKGSGPSTAPNEPATFDEATPGTQFKSTNDGWHYNWKTPKSAAGFWYTVGARLDDGTVRTVVIGLR